MVPTRRYPALTVLTIAAFLALPELAWYQYHSIERLAAAEHERAQSRLKSSSTGFARDFDREMVGAEAEIAVFGRGERDGSFRRLWAYRAPNAHLVNSVFFAEFDGSNALRLLRLEPTPAVPKLIAWPPQWSSLQRQLLGYSRAPSSISNWRVFTHDFALIHALGTALSTSNKENGPLQGHFPAGYVIVVLDRAYLCDQFLPSLAQHYFNSDIPESPVEVRILSAQDAPICDSHPRRYSALKASPQTLELISPINSRDSGRPPDQRMRLVSADAPWQLAVFEASSPAATFTHEFRATTLFVSLASFIVLTVALITLFAASRRAHTLAQAQWAFMSTVSHELRTPVSALQSVAENMSDGIVGPNKIHRYGQLILMQVRRLLEMIEDVLEFGRPPADERSEIETIDVIAVLDSALAAYAPIAESRGVEISRDIPTELSFGRCSPSALRRSLLNLIGNAVKYGAEGRSIRARVHDNGNGEIVVSVASQGCRIEPDEMKSIFEPFFRGRAAHASHLPGTGLGLPIAKKCMESFGGRISIDVEPESWIRFDLFVPAANPYEAANPNH